MKETAGKDAASKTPGQNGKPESVIFQIEKMISADKGKQWSTEEVVAKIPNAKKTTVGALLFKLRREKKIEKVGRGLWKSKT